MEPRFVDLAEVLEIHVDQIGRYGGTTGRVEFSTRVGRMSWWSAGQSQVQMVS